MEIIQIAYRIRIDGLQFNEVDFSDTTPEFKNISLRQIDANNCNYELLIKKNIFSSSDSHMRAIFNEASTEAEKFKYVFSRAADVKIFDFECLGYYRNGQLATYGSVFNNGLRISCHATATVTAGEPSVRNIKEKMKAQYDLPSIQMYYDAATVIEPVGRFISLYTLLLHKFSDNQKAVDEAILQIDPTVAQFKSPHAKNHETVFSKLRNEMSHKREGTNILETQNEIKLNVERF
jgi:hypothetical protein